MGDSTKVANKHVLPVYDQPMIYYPVATLRAMGCDDILVVTTPEAVGDMAHLLGDTCTYRAQREPNGVAGALAVAEGYVSGLFPVILGDNYVPEPPPMPTAPTVFVCEVDDPGRFGVYHDGWIVEKPDSPKSNTAVTGLYVYDDRVFDVIRGLHPSSRGELEITDVNNWYLSHGADVQHLAGWSDMGTPESLLSVALEVAG